MATGYSFSSREIPALAYTWALQNPYLAAAAAGVLGFGVLSIRKARLRAPIEPRENVVVITGCDSGFGKLSAALLTEQQFPVVCTCMTQAGVEQLTQSGVALAMICDVTKPEEIAKLFTAVEKLLDEKKDAKLWAIVNNAGIAPSGFMDWLSIESIRKVMDVNFFGVVYMVKAFLPLLKRTRGSRIINLSSCAGLTGSYGLGGYCASKHALEGMAKCLRAELVPWGIHVANINPGFMKTPLVVNSFAQAIKEFDEAPEEITSQYTKSILTDQSGAVLRMQEDPMKVVRKVADLVWEANPAFNHVVGTIPKLIIMFGVFPFHGIQEFFIWLFSVDAKVSPKKEALKRFQG